MNRFVRTLAGLTMLGALIVGRASAQRGAQTPPVTQAPPVLPAAQGSALRDMIIEDSLTPAKTELRNFIAQLRDSLYPVQALNASVTRNMNSGVSSVVLSNGRELGKRCRLAQSMVELTGVRVAALRTSDPRGDQALNSYRAGLTSLVDDLRTCQHDDSLAMAAPKPDLKRIGEISLAASDAVARYDSIRDALIRLLGISLPFKARIR